LAIGKNKVSAKVNFIRSFQTSWFGKSQNKNKIYRFHYVLFVEIKGNNSDYAIYPIVNK